MSRAHCALTRLCILLPFFVFRLVNTCVVGYPMGSFMGVSIWVYHKSCPSVKVAGDKHPVQERLNPPPPLFF